MLSLAQNYLTRGFWGDEAWTSLISQLPYLQMLKTTAADFHPPAYYTVVELWYLIFPTTEVSTRLISIIFYFLTIFLVFKLVYFIAEDRKRFWGLVAAAVVAVNPIFFQYAFEARNYTMFAFAATGSVYFLIRLLAKFDRKDAALFILFSTLGIYTHYYMFFTLFAQSLYILLFERRILLKMMGVYIVVGVLYLPWVPFLFAQLTSVSGSYWISPIVFWNLTQSISPYGTHYEALLRILGGEQPNFLQIWLFRFSFVLIVVGLIQHARQKSFEKPYILIWLWAIVPFFLATIPGLSIFGVKLPFRSIFFWRYLINAAVPLGLVIVHASQKLPKPLPYFSIALIIVMSLVVDFWGFSRWPNTFKQVYIETITPGIAPSDKLVTILPSFAEVLYYKNYFGVKNDLIILPDGLVQFSGKSLLDAYSENGVVKIADYPEGDYWELRPGPTVVTSD